MGRVGGEGAKKRVERTTTGGCVTCVQRADFMRSTGGPVLFVRAIAEWRGGGMPVYETVRKAGEGREGST
jgi:hypothetical protein